MQQAYVPISHWLDPSQTAATIIIWPLDSSAERHAELRGRLTLAIDCGAASVSLKPTAEEARALIAALQHALDNPAEPEIEPTLAVAA